MASTLEAGAVEGLIDTSALAQRLGVSQATIRSWRSRRVAWLPDPVGRLDGFVWRESDIASIKSQMPQAAKRDGTGQRNQRSRSQGAQLSERRARGAYYTPGDAAHFMAKWLVRKDSETYLEPSIGNGVLVEAVRDVVTRLDMPRPTWVANELDEATASAAVERELITQDELHVGDFLAEPVRVVDGVIANPPFVRLRNLDARQRKSALDSAEECLGTPMAPSGSVWMPFVLKMVASIRSGGRMAVVLPLDFTYVSYAIPLWRHLAASFSSLHVVRSRERIFGDINQDVLILFADGRGGHTDTIEHSAYETISDMVAQRGSVGGRVSVASVLAGERSFQRSLLPDALAEFLTEVASDGRTMPASTLATFRIGYVAGNKSFFHPSADVARGFKLPSRSLRRAAVNARRLRGRGLRTSEIGDEASDHLWLPNGDLTAGERRYVRHGEDLEVDRGYKASLRNPWWAVPGVRVPDAILTVFSERPILLVNDDSWVATNSFLCAYMAGGTSAEAFAAAWYNPLTLLSIGLEVHSLGGGVVVMVPNEASSVQVVSEDLRSADLDPVSDALHAGDVAGAYAAGGARLRDAFGAEALDLVDEGIETLSKWRAR